MSAPERKERDVRLDFFRGIAMFIIFIAHSPGNPWNDWIPARFGFSSGAELFVFCSGVASSIAFGTVFVRRGLIMGAARIAFRCWQVYWAHISIFIASIGIMVVANRLFPGHGYDRDPFGPLFADPATGLLGALTLTYLPAYLDILPMYLVILGMVPVVMALRRLHSLLPFVPVIGAYVAVWTLGITLPGDPWTGFGWFFNPFAWQLVFYSGFFIGMGWVHPPRLGDKRLMTVCLLFLVIAVPLSFWGILDNVPLLMRWHDWLVPESEKVNLHILRYVHFLALAYVVVSLVTPHRGKLATGLGGIIVTVGQQSLATFLGSLVAGRLAGIAIDLSNHAPLVVLLANLAGFAVIIAVAFTVRWFKSTPWSSHRPALKKPSPASATPEAEAHRSMA